MLTLPAGTCPPGAPEGLWRLLADGGGSVQVTDPPPQVRGAWRRFLHGVKKRGEVPAGSHLLHRGRDSGDLTIELCPGAHPSRRYRPAVSSATHPASRGGLSVPGRLVRPHPVVAALRNEPHRLPASPGNRSRSLLMLQALASAVSEEESVSSGEEDTLMVLVVRGCRYGIGVTERVGARWPQGRLTLHLIDPRNTGVGDRGVGRRDSSVSGRWADYAHRPLEDQLSDVLEEIRSRAETDAARQQERDRSDLLAKRAAQQEQEARRQQMVIRYRDDVLRQQVEAWRLATDIRCHCQDLVAAGMPAGSPWLRWARAYAEELDPLTDPPGPPEDPPEDTPLSVARASSAVPMQPRPLPEPKPWHPNQQWYSR